MFIGVKPTARQSYGLTPILEDLAELALTSNKKLSKDDFNLASSRKIEVEDAEVTLAKVEVHESRTEVEAIGGGNIAK